MQSLLLIARVYILLLWSWLWICSPPPAVRLVCSNNTTSKLVVIYIHQFRIRRRHFRWRTNKWLGGESDFVLFFICRNKLSGNGAIFIRMFLLLVAHTLLSSPSRDGLNNEALLPRNWFPDYFSRELGAYYLWRKGRKTRCDTIRRFLVFNPLLVFVGRKKGKNFVNLSVFYSLYSFSRHLKSRQNIS